MRAARLLVQRPAARARRIAGGLAALLIGVAAGAIDAADAAAVPCPALPSVAQVLADDERLRDTHGFEEERVLRDFALFWYRNVATDLVDGHGPALDVLAESFRSACPQRDVLLGWLRSLLLASQTGTDFSRRLAMARAQAVGRVP